MSAPLPPLTTRRSAVVTIDLHWGHLDPAVATMALAVAGTGAGCDNVLSHQLPGSPGLQITPGLATAIGPAVRASELVCGSQGPAHA